MLCGIYFKRNCLIKMNLRFCKYLKQFEDEFFIRQALGNVFLFIVADEVVHRKNKSFFNKILPLLFVIMANFHV